MLKSVSVKKLLALLAAQMFFYGLYIGGLQSVIADIAGGYGQGQSGVGLLITAQHITGMLMPSLMGALADKIGKKKVLVTFSLIFGIGCAVAGVSGSLFVYVIGALLIGCGYSVCESLGCAVMTDMDREQAGRYINLTQGILCVGAILGPIMMRFAMSGLGVTWRFLFAICTAAFLITGVLLLPMAFPSAVTEHKPDGKKDSALVLFKSGIFVAMFAGIIMYIGLEDGYGYFVDSMFEQRLGSDTAGALAISLYWAGMAACRFVCGMKTMNNRRVLIVCFAASAVLFIGFIISKNVTVSLIMSFFMGAAYGPIWSLIVTEAAVRFPEHSAAATGMMSTGCGIAGIIYPTIMGFTSQYAGMEIAYIMLAVTAAAGGYFCTKLPRKG